MSKLKKSISTPSAPNPAGPYSQAIVADKFVFVAGQRPQNPETLEVPDDITAQTEQCIKNVEAVLLAAGSSLENIVRTNVYLADLKYFSEMNSVYSRMVPEPFPARATVGTQLRNILVEIEVIAILND